MAREPDDRDVLSPAPADHGMPAAQLIPLVYDQLRSLARRKLADAPAERSLQTTALVHEACLRLIAKPGARWNDRQHLLAAAAQVIRWILVDRARARLAERRGAGRRNEPLDEARVGGTAAPDEEILALDQILEDLRADSPRKYEVVEADFFDFQ